MQMTHSDFTLNDWRWRRSLLWTHVLDGILEILITPESEKWGTLSKLFSLGSRKKHDPQDP